jgi:hypothetical protein
MSVVEPARSLFVNRIRMLSAVCQRTAFSRRFAGAATLVCGKQLFLLET